MILRSKCRPSNNPSTLFLRITTHQSICPRDFWPVHLRYLHQSPTRDKVKRRFSPARRLQRLTSVRDQVANLFSRS